MSSQLPLDRISNISSCYGAYSVSRLNSTYTGPTVNIRRSSDNTTADFYSDSSGKLGVSINGTNMIGLYWRPNLFPGQSTNTNSSYVLDTTNTMPSNASIVPNSTNATANTWTANGVTWTASSSSIYPGYSVFWGFNMVTPNHWNSNTYYNGNTGAYTGTFTTSIQSIGSISGEYLQIQSSTPLIMYNYTISVGGWWQAPKTFYIVGSNDNTTWYPIQYGAFTANPYNANYATSTTYIIANSSSSQTFTSNTTTTIATTSYQFSNNPYTYFRFISTSLMGNPAGANASNNETVSIGDWMINFAPPSSSIPKILTSTALQSYVLPAGTYSYTGSFTNASNDWVAVTLVNNDTSATVATVVNSNIAPWTSSSALTGSFTIASQTNVSARFSNGYYQYSSVLALNLISNVSLESWLGGSTGFITTWYDQSGKGNHATQITAANQPTINMNSKFVSFTSGSSFFNLPNGTVPQGRPYNTTYGTYISTNSAARTTIVTDNNLLENIYDSAMSATVTMNGDFIGYNATAAYMNDSRTNIVNNEFSVLYCFFDGSYTKCARVHFRKNGNIIDCYQSARLYWTGNQTTYNIATVTGNDGYTGGSGYGVLYLSVPCNTAYTVTMKHNNINNTIGCYLAGGNLANNQCNNFRRTPTQYVNYWFSNDFYGKDNVYNMGNIVTYSYDGSYKYIYINGTPQGVSTALSGWNGQAGNEFIGRNIGGEYFTGEMFYLFIFKSYLSTADRGFIEMSIPGPNKRDSVSFSQLRGSLGHNSTAISFSQINKHLGNSTNTTAKLSNFDGMSLSDGLFMKLYWDAYHNNDVSYFTSTNASVMGVTANLRDTYSAIGGFSNPTLSTNFLTNGSFAGGTNASPVGYISGGNSIVRLSNPGDSEFVLQQGGNDINIQYRFDLSTQLVASTTYIMSGWYGKSANYNGSDVMFHARAWSSSGNHIATDIGLFNILETRVVDGMTWYYCFAPINTPSDYNNTFHWYMAYGAANTVGHRYYTKLSVRRRVVYSAEWFGLFFAPTTGTYTFYMSSDESSYFWLNTNTTTGFTTGNCLINNNYVTGSREKTATISLTAGQYYPFRIQFGGSYFAFNFTPPNGYKTYDGTGYFYCQSYSSGVNLISNSNLAYYYPFDMNDMSGTTLANWGTGNKSLDTTLYNGASISVVDYKMGTSSLYLNNISSQYVQAPNFTPTTNGLSFSFWYRSNSSGTWGRIFDFGNGATNNNIDISINASGTNQLHFEVWDGATRGPNDIYLYDINYNDNTWRHIVWTLTYATAGSTASAWCIYINGALKTTSTSYYPSTSVTRSNAYIGRSNWSADGYYNGYIDDFRIYNRVVSSSEASSLFANMSSNYVIKSGSNSLITQVQGSTIMNPATSGYALWASNPWLPNGYYWIKSSAMPNALRMYVDIVNGGFDFHTITGGTSVNYITQTHSGIALGLELMIPRSQNHWKAIYRFIKTILGSHYPTWFTSLPIYKTTSGGDYTAYAMFDPRFGNSGTTAGTNLSYNGAPDWTCKDGGLWYIWHKPFGEPNGDYYANAFLGNYSEISYPQWLQSYGSCGFNDGNDNYYTGSNYIVSTNYAGSSISTLYDYFDGSTYDRAAPSAVYIKNMTGTNTNGVYWINLPTVGPTQIYCIMDTLVNGGGWMMAMKSNVASTGFTSSSTLSYPSSFTNSDVLLGTISLPSNFVAGSVTVTLRAYGGKTYANTMESGTYVNDSSGTRIITAYVGDRANNSSSFDITDTVTVTLAASQFPMTVRCWVWYGGWYVNGVTAITTFTASGSSGSSTTFPYDSGHWTSVTTLNPGNTNRAAGDAKFNTMNYFPSKDMLALWPDIPYNYNSGTGGSLSLSTYNNWCWMKNNYNTGARQTLINYFSTASNVSFGAAKGVERGTAFSSQGGNGFYGVNFTSFANMKVRWGFAWNNENDWNSNDVIGGIGMYANWGTLQSFSAGDQIGCCQDQTGINRAARVEMYIR